MPSDLHIRPARADDIGSISALLLRASYSRTTWPSLLQGDFIRLYVDEPQAVTRVAERGNRMVGVAFGHKWGSLGWLGPLAVSAPERRAGIGRTLVAEVVASLTQSGCRAVALDSDADPGVVVPFYQQLQFHRVEDTVSLFKELSSSDRGAGTWLCPDDEAVRFRQGADEICRTDAGGLVLMVFIEWWRARGWGEGYLLEVDGVPAALAVVMHRRRFIHESEGVVRLAVLLHRAELNARSLCDGLAAALRRHYPSARYLYVRARADEERSWQEAGWRRHGYGQRWILPAQAWPLCNGLFSLE